MPRQVSVPGMTAESHDGLVVASVGQFGELLELRLEREAARLGIAELQEQILQVIGAAQEATEEQLRESTGCTDVDAYPHGIDLALAPVLAELDKARADTAGHRPGQDELPAPQDFMDYGGFRDTLVELRERLVDFTATATSRDQLVTVTVDGTGRLLELRLDDRLGRAHDIVAVQRGITDTARRALESCRADVDRISRVVLGSEPPAQRRGY